MTLSSADALLDQKTMAIEKMIQLPFEDDSLKLLGPVKNEKMYGKSLSVNKPIKLTSGGSFARGAETDGSSTGTLPTGVDSTSITGSYAVKKMFFSMDFTDEQLVAMEGGRAQLHTTFEEELADAMKAFKARQGALFFSRGDGIVARVNGAVSSSATVQCDSPVLAIEGDTLLGYTTRGTNSAGTMSTARTVDWVDYDNAIIYLTATASAADEECLSYSNGVVDQSSTLCQWFLGMQAHLDNVNDSSFGWDAGDGATFDHVDTYLGQARGTYRKLNCQTHNASSAVINEYLLSRAAQMSANTGMPMSEMLYVMHPQQYSRICRYFVGIAKIGDSQEIMLPGGKTAKLPVITVAGGGQVPVLQSRYMKDGVIACVGRKDFEQHSIPGAWITQGGTKMLLVPYGTGNTYFHKYRCCYKGYWQTACNKPYRQSLVYGLSTSNA